MEETLLIDNNFLDLFKKYCLVRNWNFDKFTSEFTFQFRLSRFLDEKYKIENVELEVNIQKYNIDKKLSKKEIDLIIEDKKKIIPIEIKFLRDKGSFNIGLFEFCKDINFIESLIENNFKTGYAILFTNLEEIFNHTKKSNPKHIENIYLYDSFRVQKKISGNYQIKTGNLHKNIIIKSTYKIEWLDFLNNIKCCIIKI